MNRLLKAKKGISPILATLLLIVIAVAAVIVTYAWVMTFTGTQTQQGSVMLINENVSWPDGDTISVVIRNTGTSNGKVTAVYVGLSSTNVPPATVSAPGLPATVASGGSTTFTITYTWTANTRYYFKFATDTPATLDFSELSP